MQNENRTLKILASSLSLRIMLWVFVSVIVIEVIILIPSLKKRENEFLSQMEKVTSAELSLLLRLTESSTTEQELLEKIKNLPSFHHIEGGIFSYYDDAIIGVFGEKPELTIPDIKKNPGAHRLHRDISRYDFAVIADGQTKKYILIARRDSSDVMQELYAFFWRVAGLVFIISIFVTAAAWIALKPIVVSPILNLRSDLIRAGDAISNDRQPQPFYSATIKRSDELGDIITSFNHMFEQITDVIQLRKEAEKERQINYQQIESISALLNAELEKGRQIQRNFFPNRSPLVPGWEISNYFK